MFQIYTIFFLILGSVVSEECRYNFEATRRPEERDANTAYHKERFISKIQCSKYCTDNSECMGFNMYEHRRGDVICAFFKNFATSSEMSNSGSVSYFERTCDGILNVNSAQYYHDRKYLVLNGDDRVVTYNVNSFSRTNGIDGALDAILPISKFYGGWSAVPQAALNLFHLPGSPTLLFNGDRLGCYKRYSKGSNFERCKEDDTYSMMGDVMKSSGKPLDALTSDVSTNQFLVALSNNIVYFANKTSSKGDSAIVYRATEKYMLRNNNIRNSWRNLPDGVTALVMINDALALVFVRKQYHIYDKLSRTLVKSGYMCTPDGGCPKRFQLFEDKEPLREERG